MWRGGFRQNGCRASRFFRLWLCQQISATCCDASAVMQASTTWPVQDMPELVQSTLDTWPFNRELYSTISMQCVAATRTRLVCPLGPWRATTPPAELYSFRPHPHTPYTPSSSLPQADAVARGVPWRRRCSTVTLCHTCPCTGRVRASSLRGPCQGRRRGWAASWSPRHPKSYKNQLLVSRRSCRFT